jgi:hypothetical protein
MKKKTDAECSTYWRDEEYIILFGNSEEKILLVIPGRR